MSDLDEIEFLTIADVTEIHAESIRLHSPGESVYLRDAGLLESAVMAPQQTWGGEYLNGSLEEMAAAYFCGIVQNHPFENGNKRVSFASAIYFLLLNGYELTLSQDEAVELVLHVVSHTWGKEEATEVIASHLQELSADGTGL